MAVRNRSSLLRQSLSAGVASVALMTAATPVLAASDFFGTPNTTTGTAPVNTGFQGQLFVNLGLVGAGRLSANTIDFNGDTLGSFSGMALDLSTWRRSGAGYTGTLWTLPDRGFNAGGFFSNYQGRLHRFTIGFTPYTGADLPAATTSQNQLTFTANGGILLRDFNNVATTGEDPATGTTVQNGFTLPQVHAGFEGAGRVSLDAEALAFRSDGSFYVGDEYTGGIYYFDATGRMAGFLPPVGAVRPVTGGLLNYNSINAPTDSGRRNNQGMEAVSLTPDGRTLFGVLQSATVQDSTGSQETRLHTRVVAYDVSGSAFPSAPIGHYVLELPRFDRDGTGGAADRTAAQSEILALNTNQFLLLTRDGNGNGNGDSRPHVFKSIYLVDTSPATNLAGTAFDTGTTPVSPGGVLSPTITPVANTQFVNMLNTTQLTRFGLNLDANTADLTRTNNLLTLSEKWEALALAPVLDDSVPQDFFLFVGNDNDFQTPAGTMQGDLEHNAFNGVAAPNVQNDNMILVYRVTLPTYVDPQYLQAMKTHAPIVMAALGEGAVNLAGGNGRSVHAHLDAARREGATNTGGAWMTGSFETIDPTILGREYTSEGGGFSLGLETAQWLPGVLLGGSFGYARGESDVANAYGYDYQAASYTLYAAVSDGPLFGQASATYGTQDYNEVIRPAAYGLIARGNSSGTSTAISARAGYLFGHGTDFMAGPVGELTFVNAEVNGFVEGGAAGGNIAYQEQELSQFTASVGLEATFVIDPGFKPVFRGGYTFENGDGDRSGLVKLASVNHALASTTVVVPGLEGDFYYASVGAQGHATDRIYWHVAYDAEFGSDHSDDLTQRVMAGIGVHF